MVKKGCFEVQLVDAETKEPFKEHTAPAGEIYVEVEPDAEYFIRVYSGAEHDVQAKFFVDGKRLDYSAHFDPNCGDNIYVCDYGILSVCGGRECNTAFKVSKIQAQQSRDGNGSIASSLWTGRVKVKLYKAQFSRTDRRSNQNENPDFSADFKKGNLGRVGRTSRSKKMKGVHSTRGETIEAHNLPETRSVYAEGRLLNTFVLYYCSAPGLINAGILPKPPAWDYARIVTPFKRDASEGGDYLGIEPKKIKFECTDDVIASKEYDFFDLSNLDDSGDEDEKTCFSRDAVKPE